MGRSNSITAKSRLHNIVNSKRGLVVCAKSCCLCCFSFAYFCFVCWFLFVMCFSCVFRKKIINWHETVLITYYYTIHPNIRLTFSNAAFHSSINKLQFSVKTIFRTAIQTQRISHISYIQTCKHGKTTSTSCVKCS